MEKQSEEREFRFLTCVMSQSPTLMHYTVMEQFTKTQIKELKVLVGFVNFYCRQKHSNTIKEKVELAWQPGRTANLCRECAALVKYAVIKRRNCPLDPKPSCKNCRIHCYGKEYRARIKEIMAFSGRRMIMRGRIDYLWHYLF